MTTWAKGYQQSKDLWLQRFGGKIKEEAPTKKIQDLGHFAFSSQAAADMGLCSRKMPRIALVSPQQHQLRKITTERSCSTVVGISRDSSTKKIYLCSFTRPQAVMALVAQVHGCVLVAAWCCSSGRGFWSWQTCCALLAAEAYQPDLSSQTVGRL
jgi:hypothetical protein